jgi:peroxiredoxin Q/BCP
MSTKTCEKSDKSSAAKTPRLLSKAKAKTPATKSKRPTASKPGKNSKTGRAKASHSPPSKTLSPTAPGTRFLLAEGEKAPSFRLPRDGGNTVSLADYANQKLVLFFYPRADTPGCTREAIDFTRLSKAFAAAGTAILGVSADPPKAQEAFRNKHQLGVPLASDETHEMLAAYGVWGEKSMYGRTFLGILRTTVLIGATGKIVKVWRNVKVDGHAEEVLAAARAA